MCTMRSPLATGIHLYPMKSRGQGQAWLGQPFLAPSHVGSPWLGDLPQRVSRSRSQRLSGLLQGCLSQSPRDIYVNGTSILSVCVCVCTHTCVQAPA